MEVEVEDETESVNLSIRPISQFDTHYFEHVSRPWVSIFQ